MYSKRRARNTLLDVSSHNTKHASAPCGDLWVWVRVRRGGMPSRRREDDGEGRREHHPRLMTAPKDRGNNFHVDTTHCTYSMQGMLRYNMVRYRNNIISYCPCTVYLWVQVYLVGSNTYSSFRTGCTYVHVCMHVYWTGTCTIPYHTGTRRAGEGRARLEDGVSDLYTCIGWRRGDTV